MLVKLEVQAQEKNLVEITSAVLAAGGHITGLSLQTDSVPALTTTGRKQSSTVKYSNTRRRWSADERQLLENDMQAYPDEQEFKQHALPGLVKSLGRTSAGVLAKRWTLIKREETS